MNPLIAFIMLLPFSICAAGAVYLAANGIDGWGWFLFVAALAIAMRYHQTTGGSKK